MNPSAINTLALLFIRICYSIPFPKPYTLIKTLHVQISNFQHTVKANFYGSYYVLVKMYK